MNVITIDIGVYCRMDSLPMLGGVGLFSASGAVLMHPEKRGIFRMSNEDLSQ